MGNLLISKVKSEFCPTSYSLFFIWLYNLADNYMSNQMSLESIPILTTFNSPPPIIFPVSATTSLLFILSSFTQRPGGIWTDTFLMDQPWCECLTKPEASLWDYNSFPLQLSTWCCPAKLCAREDLRVQ